MATVLSQHSYGRILLHIVAMLIDRQIRWHCAGVVREVCHGLTFLEPRVVGIDSVLPQRCWRAAGIPTTRSVRRASRTWGRAGFARSGALARRFGSRSLM